jgi:hypothetical protein
VAGRCRREEDVTNKLFQAARPYTSDGQKYRVGHATIGLAFGAKLTVTSDETSVRRGATRRAQANAQRKWLLRHPVVDLCFFRSFSTASLRSRHFFASFSRSGGVRAGGRCVGCVHVASSALNSTHISNLVVAYILVFATLTSLLSLHL